MQDKKFASPIVIVAHFFFKIFFTNTKTYFKAVIYDILILKAEIEIYKKLKEDGMANNPVYNIISNINSIPEDIKNLYLNQNFILFKYKF